MNEEKESGKRIAIIRIRGGINVRGDIKDAMAMLRLYRKNCCVVVNGSPSIMGTINKIKDYVTWGEIDDDTFKLLVEKRGELYKGRKKRFIELGGKKYKLFFRLNPPRGGFERKGIKVPFTKSGALGYRKEKINDLIKKMV